MYDKVETPFMWKILNGKPHWRAKCRDKLICWNARPKKKPISVKIPKRNQMMVEEDVRSRCLSGGQWQRIALARAFMRMEEADLLILDEPSSALDPQAEYQVFKSIMDLRNNKTTIYIVPSSMAELMTLVPSLSYRAGCE
jgi:ABC-type Mn2+/Zn2+ transport system ATPase subunit